jgi:hypothetical protein
MADFSRFTGPAFKSALEAVNKQMAPIRASLAKVKIEPIKLPDFSGIRAVPRFSRGEVIRVDVHLDDLPLEAERLLTAYTRHLDEMGWLVQPDGDWSYEQFAQGYIKLQESKKRQAKHEEDKQA